MTGFGATGLGRMMRGALLAVLAMSAAGGAVPGAAQVTSVDPDQAIDADLARPAAAPPAADPAVQGDPVTTVDPAPVPAATTQGAPPPAGSGTPPAGTYQQDDLIGAAEGVFGKGAKGVAEMIQDILKKQGEPNAYIVGREGGAAIGIGLRYGSGTLHHKIEGQRPVYWTGPSIGFDAGANAGNTFVLVYNLYNSEDLYKRYPAGEGQAYLVGGFNVSYLRRGDVVLIPVRAGVGLRLGVNAGYMKFTKKRRIIPL